MNIQQAISALVEGQDLGRSDMQSVMRQVMTGQATDAQIGGFLVALRIKGETVDEVTAAAEVMRELAASVQVQGDHLLDTCGTGGDASGTFNISTAVAFVAAAAGAQVAKHGNRSITSKSGSADVLETAGVNLALKPDQVAACIDNVGVGFMFAPMHHSAMKHAIGPRKELALRTVFNVLGPLTNPASAPHQVLGVYDARWLRPLAEVLKQLGSKHALIVHGSDGLDEITLSGQSRVAELKDGEINEYSIKPEDFGIESGSLDAVKARDSDHSLQLIRAALGGESGSAADIIALNAGAAIYAAGIADTLKAGVAKAQQLLLEGSALEKINQLATFSSQYKDAT